MRTFEYRGLTWNLPPKHTECESKHHAIDFLLEHTHTNQLYRMTHLIDYDTGCKRESLKKFIEVNSHLIEAVVRPCNKQTYYGMVNSLKLAILASEQLQEQTQ